MAAHAERVAVMLVERHPVEPELLGAHVLVQVVVVVLRPALRVDHLDTARPQPKTALEQIAVSAVT